MAFCKNGHYKNVFLHLQYYLLPNVYWRNYWANLYVTENILKMDRITEQLLWLPEAKAWPFN